MHVINIRFSLKRMSDKLKETSCRKSLKMWKTISKVLGFDNGPPSKSMKKKERPTPRFSRKWLNLGKIV